MVEQNKTIRSMNREEYNAYYRERRRIRKSTMPEVVWLKDIQKKEEQHSAKPVKKNGLPRWMRRRIARKKKIPGNMICSGCMVYKPRSNQWVIKGDYIGCLSCYMKKKEEKNDTR